MNIIIHYISNEIEWYDGDYEVSPDYVEIRNITTENSTLLIEGIVFNNI